MEEIYILCMSRGLFYLFGHWYWPVYGRDVDLFLWIITRQFRDANSNGAVISLAIIVREFKVQYMHVYMIHVYRVLVLIDMFKCHYCYINHDFAKILISMNKEQLNLKSLRYVYTCKCSGPMELICYIRNLLHP